MGALRTIIYGLLILYGINFFFGIPVHYAFKVKPIKEIASKQSGMFYRENELRKKLKNDFPGYILATDSFHWFPINSGGLRGAVSVLYGSFTEFMILYHVQADAMGSTGRHFMNVSSTVLEGQMTYSLASASRIPPLTLNAGDNYVLRKGESANVKLNAGTTLLVYGRGFVPLTMGYWISQTLFIDHDPMLAITTIFIFVKACVLSKGSVFYWFAQWIWKLVDYCMLLPQVLGDLYQTTVQYVKTLLKA